MHKLNYKLTIKSTSQTSCSIQQVLCEHWRCPFLWTVGSMNRTGSSSVVNSCISNNYAAAIYFMALEIFNGFMTLLPPPPPPYICEKHKINHECCYQLTFYHYHCFFYLKSASKTEHFLKLISDRKSNGSDKINH